MPEKKSSDEICLDSPHEQTCNNAADNKSMTGTGDIDTTSVEWSPDNEKIMIEWCDVAQCYKWLNYRSHGKLSTMHAWFTIPAIVLSTISGTASFAQESFPDNIKSYAPAIIGSINIFIGILTTIQQYLKISELNEAHRVSAISWDKFARNIRIELAKKPAERDNAGHFLKQCRQEFDRLMETSPSINDNVIDEFTHKFSGKPGTDKRLRFERLRKPDICDTIVSVDETRNKWYEQLAGLSSDITDKVDDAAVRARDNFILEQKQLIEEKEAELSRHIEMQQKSVRVQLENVERASQLRKVQETYFNDQVTIINTYISGYKNIYFRKPTADELKEYFANIVSSDILDKFLETYA
jgi:type III secretory pathway component EscR